MSDTAAIWRKRVSSWRASGETADAFAARNGFAANTLRWWSSRLGREAAPAPVVRLAQFVRSPTSERVTRSSIVIELLEARARITVDADADRGMLADVIDLLLARSAR
jgi:hypothetical protein